MTRAAAPERQRVRPDPAAGAEVRDQAERIVIGAMLTSPAAVEEVTAAGLTSGDFARPHHGTAYAYLIAAYGAGEPCEPVALADRLLAAGELRGELTAGWLLECQQAVPVAASVGWYAGIVADHAGRRRLAEAAARLAQVAEMDDSTRRGELVTQLAAELTSSGAGGGRVRGEPLDWSALLGQECPPPDWLPGRLLAAGEHAALVGDGKAGKSLLALDWALRAATGQPWLDGRRSEPRRVLYVDRENSAAMIRERMLSLGAGPGDQLDHLVYLAHPPWRPLDTAGGGADLVAAVEAHRPDVVILDTVSRMISGAENDADTWLSLYRHALVPLKSRGVASLRLDHTGKDAARGSRGSSAKTQDVDAVWTLSAPGEGLVELTRTHTRSGHGPDRFMIRRHGERVGDGQWKPGGTWHELVSDDERPAVGEQGGRVSPAARRVLAVLQAADGPLTVREIGDRVAADGQPLKSRTIQLALNTLAEIDKCSCAPTGRGTAAQWTAEGS